MRACAPAVPSTSAARRAPRAGVLVVLFAAVALAAPSPAAALKVKACEGQRGYVCGTLAVPLDHSGAVAGTLKLAVGMQRTRPKGGGVLIALSGGPGQSSVDAVSQFGQSLKPMLSRYRLVTFDQRGTGPLGALNCPNLQTPSPLVLSLARQVAACANALGPKRSYYSTRDSVADIEALRVALGADKVALMGVSYGTYVAQQYARAHPDRVERLVLDSVVPPGGADPFLLDTYAWLPRVMRDQCAGGKCRLATRHPVADLAAVAATLRKGQIKGPAYDANGRARTARYEDEPSLMGLVTSVDLNPFMQARMPGALSAAARGDTAALLHMRRLADGPPVTAKELSFGLFFTTLCLDESLPFALTSPLAGREAAARAALDAIPASRYAPWSTAAVLDSSDAANCSLFPRQASAPEPLGPLPDVPTLLLAGGLDMRTPIESAEAVKALLPRAALVVVPGTGHDELDTDGTGCAARALRRWITGASVGNPCQGQSNQIDPFPRPPRALSDFTSNRQVPGPRGRVVFAVLDTVQDARFSVLESLFAGFSASGGGLRGGGFRATDAFHGRLTLRRVSYLKGLRVSGVVRVDGPAISGKVTLSGLATGTLELDDAGGATGTVDGRRVRFRVPSGSAAAASHRADGSRMPRLSRRQLQGLRAALARR